MGILIVITIKIFRVIRYDRIDRQTDSYSGNKCFITSASEWHVKSQAEPENK